MAESVKKDDIIKINIDDLANGGDGVGHYNGLAIFVPGGIPGEKIKARITAKKKSYARAYLVEVLEPAAGRITPQCSVSSLCGGCQLQHISYELQLKLKKKIIEDLLMRLGGMENIKVNDMLGTDFPWQYRNKAQFPLAEDKEGNILTGFYQQRTHNIIPHQDCGIQHPLINRIAGETVKVLNKYDLSAYNEQKHTGILRHLLIRVGVCTNQALLTLVSYDRFPHQEEIAGELMEKIPELKGVLQNLNPVKTNVILGEKTELIKGQDYYIDYIGQVKFAISPESFFQVNTLQAEKLYGVVLKYASLNGSELVLDAYCGTGSIALFIAKDAGRVVGVEEVESAIEDAWKNTRLNSITNCQFETGRVEDKLPLLMEKGLKPDLVIFDPPRKGLAETVVTTLLEARPAKVIYVSCNPATLARDLSRLKKEYRVVEVQPVDMFPQTYHVECVVLLEKI